MDRDQVAAMSDREVALWWGVEDDDFSDEQLEERRCDNYATLLHLWWRGWIAVGLEYGDGIAELTEDEHEAARTELAEVLPQLDYSFVPTATANKGAHAFLERFEREDDDYENGNILPLIPELLQWFDAGQIAPRS